MTVGRRWQWNKISAGETCSVTPPPHNSNREGCEVCQIGGTHRGLLKHPDCSHGGSHWPLWWCWLNGQFITNCRCGCFKFNHFLHTWCPVLILMTSVVVEVEIAHNNVPQFYLSREHKMCVSELSTSHLGAEYHDLKFYCEPLSSSNGAVMCCAHSQPHR